MNWFVRTGVSGNSAAHNTKLLNQDAGCEHVEKDIGLAYALRSEKDTFGTVGSYLCCKECDDLAETRDDELEEICRDCGKTHKAKDGIAWKWYDFYAPQGDEPLQICDECKKLPKHIERVRADRADYEAETGPYDDGEDVFDDSPDLEPEVVFTLACSSCKTDVQEYEADWPDGLGNGPLVCTACKMKQLKDEVAK